MTTLELNYRAALALIAIQEHTTRLAIDAYFKIGNYGAALDCYADLDRLEARATEVHADYLMELTADFPTDGMDDSGEYEIDWVATIKAMDAHHDNDLYADPYAAFHKEEFAAAFADLDELPF